MREIKFRAWNKKDKEMEDEFSLDSNGSRVFTQEGSPDFFYPEPYEDIEHKTWILMQYTGLKDKNGKEIYEGDIVKDNYNEVGIVSFGEHLSDNSGFEYAANVCTGFYVANPEVGENDYPRNWGQFYETGYIILGNIYENPELLPKPSVTNPNLLQENK